MHTNTWVKAKLFLCLIKRHTMKPFGRTDVELHASTSALVRWASSQSDRITAGKHLPSGQSKKARCAPESL